MRENMSNKVSMFGVINLKTVLIYFLIGMFVFAFLPVSPVDAASAGNSGIYVLGNFFSKYELSRDYVTGISLRIGWDSIEGQKGIYDWSYLDSNIANARKYGKKVMIRVTAGENTPEWVYREGAEQFFYTENGVNLCMPVPWDSIYLQEWTNFILELGVRYGNMQDIVTIHMTGPAKAGEMYLADYKNITAWLNKGYSAKKLTHAWKTVINAYAEAFHSNALGINISKPIMINGSNRIVTDVLSYAYQILGSRLRVQGNWLSASTSDTFVLYNIVAYYADFTNVGFQMLCIASQQRFGGTLRQGIDKGLAAGASYLEIYGVDVENTAYESDFIYADYYLKLNEH